MSYQRSYSLFAINVNYIENSAGTEMAMLLITSFSFIKFRDKPARRQNLDKFILICLEYYLRDYWIGWFQHLQEVEQWYGTNH